MVHTQHRNKVNEGIIIDRAGSTCVEHKRTARDVAYTPFVMRWQIHLYIIVKASVLPVGYMSFQRMWGSSLSLVEWEDSSVLIDDAHVLTSAERNHRTAS